MPAVLLETNRRDFLIEIGRLSTDAASLSSISFSAGGRKNARNQTLRFILSSATNILHDLWQISTLLLVIAPKKALEEIKLHFQIGLVVRNNCGVTKLNVSFFL